MKHSTSNLKKMAVLCLASSCLCGTVCTAGADDSRPNILFIIVDDQSPYDLKIYNPLGLTPGERRPPSPISMKDAA